ncbi:hypothetical protein OF83DRAFT_1179995 [Amylostereum chailletii]|nr:hypothetical protein OF83DRAFT_1179995 [Amylostereum chailletii]
MTKPDRNDRKPMGKGRTPSKDEDDDDDVTDTFEAFSVQDEGESIECTLSKGNSSLDHGPATQGVPATFVKAHKAGEFEDSAPSTQGDRERNGANDGSMADSDSGSSEADQERDERDQSSTYDKKGKGKADEGGKGKAREPSQEEWYVVTRGYIPGVFTLSEAIDHTLGFVHGEYRYGSSYGNTWYIFRQALRAGEVNILGDETLEENSARYPPGTQGLGFHAPDPSSSIDSLNFLEGQFAASDDQLSNSHTHSRTRIVDFYSTQTRLFQVGLVKCKCVKFTPVDTERGCRSPSSILVPCPATRKPVVLHGDSRQETRYI